MTLKRHFWGLVGPHWDSFFIFLNNLQKTILWGPKRPQKCLCACFWSVPIKVEYPFFFECNSKAVWETVRERSLFMAGGAGAIKGGKDLSASTLRGGKISVQAF